ncbi:glutathione S-transferase C-terminal domain-containing protein [Roseateles albus]|uniref:Glutathione S-transferase N-terminal domain-containing protein n=1 Tax=Roseateles albus TaxID=2987525 RepID=A0ABT5KA37_9BURK|nr:glutathione S-transferase C-terminal domain-containing protein [Roseateles albus]MDC8770294.1 glutathione S-transferase N-terminal domain-containing protein [Roseateles albus]
MKLIGSLTSPFVRKVRIVMAEKKLDYQLVLEDVWSSDAILKMNPLGKVPCLVMDGQDSITGAVFDSRVIVEYVDTLSPVGKLIPERGRERTEVKTWEALADGVMDAAVLALLENKFAGRPPEQRCEAWVQRQLDKVAAACTAMNQGLGDKAWCWGNHFSLADIAVGCALGYLDFRFPAIAWRDANPNLARHFEKLSARQSFIDTAPPAP